MSSPLSAFVEVTFVATADTPAVSQPYAGKVISIPPEYLTVIGSGPSSPGKLLGVRGYMQTNATTGAREWVMTDVLDTATRDAIRTIPPGGWVNLDARQVYRQQARRMIESWNVPTADVIDVEQKLYAAAVLNATPG